MMNIEVMTKRVEFIGTMKDSLTLTNDEGEEVPFFSPKFLIMKYLKMSEADLELNEKYKMEEKLAGKSDEEDEDNNEDDETEDIGGDEGGDEGEDEGGSESDETSDEIDDEMLGDVMPESPETSEA